MKKLALKIATAAVCVCMAVLPLAACGGNSAYDVAVRNGFVGTEAEWIESLKGDSAYDVAVKNGFTGTEAEWLAGLKGQDGLDADDNAYDIAVKNGFTGTQKEWLASLKGADGKNGTDAVDYLYDKWKQWSESGEYTGTYLEFLTAYDAAAAAYGYDGGVAAVSKALCSSVIVFGEFTAQKQVGMSGGMFGSAVYGNYTTIGAGAGAIYSYDKSSGTAYIVTNYHVVYSSDSVSKRATKLGVCLYGEYPTVTTAKNAKYPSLTDSTLASGYVEAEFVGGSADADVAVLKVDFSGKKDTHSIAAATVVDSDHLSLGQKAIAIGNPSGSGFSATTGTLSVDSEYIYMESITDSTATARFRVMRVDTAINAGNSGGGLYDAAGNLIGLVNAKTSSSQIDNISYAIPANIVRGVADNVIRHESTVSSADSRYNKLLLGISTTAGETSNRYDSATGTITLTETITVNEISDGSAAASSDLAVGDVIVSALLTDSSGVAKSVRGSTDALVLTRNFQLSDYMTYADAGDKIILVVTRGGEEKTITVTLG